MRAKTYLRLLDYSVYRDFRTLNFDRNSSSSSIQAIFEELSAALGTIVKIPPVRRNLPKKYKFGAVIWRQVDVQVYPVQINLVQVNLKTVYRHRRWEVN